MKKHNHSAVTIMTFIHSQPPLLLIRITTCIGNAQKSITMLIHIHLRHDTNCKIVFIYTHRKGASKNVFSHSHIYHSHILISFDATQFEAILNLEFLLQYTTITYNVNLLRINVLDQACRI